VAGLVYNGVGYREDKDGVWFVAGVLRDANCGSKCGVWVCV